MSLLQATDIIDELIKPVVEKTPAFLTNVDDYLNNLVQSVDSTKGVADIPIPMPYKVKQLAIAKCCMDVCVAKFGGQVGAYFKGEEGQDRWYTKLKFYKNLVDELESTMTLETLIGTRVDTRNIYTIPLERG